MTAACVTRRVTLRQKVLRRGALRGRAAAPSGFDARVIGEEILTACATSNLRMPAPNATGTNRAARRRAAVADERRAPTGTGTNKSPQWRLRPDANDGAGRRPHDHPFNGLVQRVMTPSAALSFRDPC